MLISKVDDPFRVVDFINLDEVVECELKTEDEPAQHVSGRPDTPDSAAGATEEDPENLELIIRTTEDGNCGGRSYIYRTTFDDANKWEEEIGMPCRCCTLWAPASLMRLVR